MLSKGRFWIILYLLALPTISAAQFNVEKSVNLKVLGANPQFGIMPIGKQGVVLFNEVRDNSNYTKRKWEVICMDSLLEIRWTSYFESDYNFRISHVKYYHETLYLLFEDTNIPVKRAFFVRTSIYRDNFEFFELADFLPNDITGFEILGNSLFLIGSDNDRPSIVRFAFGDPRPLVLKGFYEDRNALLSTSVVPEKNVVQMITKMRQGRGKPSMIILKQFDESGEILKDITIESNRGYHLLDAIATTNEDGNICLIGTYNDGRSKLSQGIFSMVIDNESHFEIYYYEYLNLHNFLSYLPNKERQNIESKYKADNGGKKRNVYRINHELRTIKPDGDGWLFMGEVLNSVKRNSSATGYMWPTEYYIYSHAIMLGIDSGGKLRWDNSMGLDGLSANYNQQRVFLSQYGNSEMAYYIDEGMINYKTFYKGNIASDPEIIEFALPENALNVQQRISTNLFSWYDNKLLSVDVFLANWRGINDWRLYNFKLISVDNNDS